MSTKPMTECDRCQTIRKSGNHWFKSGLLAGALLFKSATAGPLPDGVENERDLCGDRCATNELQEYLASQMETKS